MIINVKRGSEGSGGMPAPSISPSPRKVSNAFGLVTDGAFRPALRSPTLTLPLALLSLATAAELRTAVEFDGATPEVASEGRGEWEPGAGTCSDQTLIAGVQLPDLPLFYTRHNPGSAWGSAVMIDAIVSVSRHMHWLIPTASPISIGDIAREWGGTLSGHLTHRGGVDADIGIYSTGASQNPRGFDSPGPKFDVVANWALVSAFLDTGTVEFILLDRAHIARLQAYTLRMGLLTAGEAAAIFPTGARPWEHTGIVRHAPSHDNHLHVRVLCGDGSRARP